MPAVTLPKVQVLEKWVSGYQLTKTVKMKGRGVFTNTPATVEIDPAPLGEGISFLLNGQKVRAIAEESVDLPNCSGLGQDQNARAILVEHILSALAGLSIWDAQVTLKGPEVPLWDGSALPIAQELLAASRWGKVTRKIVVIEQLFNLLPPTDEKALTLKPSANLTRFSYNLIYKDPPLNQVASVTLNPKRYLNTIAPARTFIGENQARELKAAGILKGGTRENAIVLKESELDTMEWRLPKEAARHKILDMIGDFALIGAPFAGIVQGWLTGHAHNRALAALIRKSALSQGLE